MNENNEDLLNTNSNAAVINNAHSNVFATPLKVQFFATNILGYANLYRKFI